MDQRASVMLRVEGGDVQWRGVTPAGVPVQWLLSAYRVDQFEWSPWQNAPSVSESQLRKAYGRGTHVFQVKVRNPRGMESDVKQVLITLR